MKKNNITVCRYLGLNAAQIWCWCKLCNFSPFGHSKRKESIRFRVASIWNVLMNTWVTSCYSIFLIQSEKYSNVCTSKIFQHKLPLKYSNTKLLRLLFGGTICDQWFVNWIEQNLLKWVRDTILRQIENIMFEITFRQLWYTIH